MQTTNPPIDTLNQAMHREKMRFLPDDFYLHQLTPITDGDAAHLDLPTPAITASIGNLNGKLHLAFFIQKTPHTEQIFANIPKQLPSQAKSCDDKSSNAVRADFLWESDCFECFFGPKQAKGYFEVNAATDGRYNIYRFDDYRTPKQLPPVADDDHRLIFDGHESFSDGYVCRFAIAHHHQPLDLSMLDVNLTAILYPLVAGVSVPIYYASRHATPPDFHCRQYWLG
ncbi:hypothetical protein ACFBZI_01875 [Moraxella sp. ZJ142]|uniref:hypothetical protein n=1 Tax=Moraxella marmotae TaxID=3344520 RepID=UPI0035D514CD